MSNLYRGLSIDASYQVSVQLCQTISEEKNLNNQPIRKKNRLWWPCLLTDRDGMSNLYRGLFIDASCQVSVQLCQTISEEKNLKNQPIRNKIRLWRPCLLTDRDGLSNRYRGPSIDVSYQVSDHLAQRFHRRRFLEIDQSEKRIASDGHVC
jgi:hypothetical protein